MNTKEHSLKGTFKVAALSIVQFCLSLTSWKRIFYIQQHAEFDAWMFTCLSTLTASNECSLWSFNEHSYCRSDGGSDRVAGGPGAWAAVTLWAFNEGPDVPLVPPAFALNLEWTARAHQLRPTLDGYTLNAPVVRNNPVRLASQAAGSSGSGSAAWHLYASCRHSAPSRGTEEGSGLVTGREAALKAPTNDSGGTIKLRDWQQHEKIGVWSVIVHCLSHKHNFS